MAIDWYLAMTAAEIRANSRLPQKIGWFSCHFSPCGAGLSNLPGDLPAGSLLILDDFVPFHGHDPERIAAQLRECIEKRKCGSLLLDFQRPGEAGTTEIAKAVVEALPCPVGVSELYAGGLDCPVFLPPVPPDMPIGEYLEPWKSREVWLDIAPAGVEITLTTEGATAAPLPVYEIPAGIVHADEALHCRYTVSLEDDRALFRLYRTREDLTALAAHAAELGVKKCVGLWQELAEG